MNSLCSVTTVRDSVILDDLNEDKLHQKLLHLYSFLSFERYKNCV